MRTVSSLHPSRILTILQSASESPFCYVAGVARDIRKAVLLAAGRGLRLGALTDRVPKPMLEVARKPLIGHIVDAFAANEVRDIAIVTGYLAGHIDGWCTSRMRESPDLRLTMVHQGELNGTAGAMLLAQDFVAGDDLFIFGWGDILMDAENYARFILCARSESYDLMLSINRVRDPCRGGAVYVDAEMGVQRLVEKPAPGTSTTQWNNAGLFAATPRIFDYLAKLKPTPRGELELPEAIAMMTADRCQVRALEVRGFWSDVGTPEDLESARKLFKPPQKK
jgi:UDP-N-acetylglucosamine diphosphorylase / glucose-1-phosphate thymidylyltransferase / UDP-N-acetylgalactosamine diphosphorylase / glucosamine-1-phosphate N-acetyltransferase / galactosamine-1-phosphate N-acetyltransferase